MSIKNDTIHLRTAQALRLIIYVALLLILLALTLSYFRVNSAGNFAFSGIGLILFAPLIGILTIGYMAIFTGKKIYIIYCILLVFIYIIAYIVGV